MKEETVLAPNFVPDHLKDIYKRHATTYPSPDLLSASGVEASYMEELRANLVPMCMEDPNMRAELCPIRQFYPEDYLYYALSNHEEDSPLKQQQENGGSEPFSLLLPHSKDATTVAEYHKTFEALLIEERRQMLLLYERYSQYNITLTMAEERTATPTVPSSSSPSVVRCFASIRGIADANPPLQPGDHVMVRFIRPRPSRFHHGTMATDVLEVRSLVNSIQRAKGGMVHFSWLDPALKLGFRDKKPMRSCFLRFIPNHDMHAYSLSALDWLLKSNEQYIRPLLFPTAAPVLPSHTRDFCRVETSELNVNQRDFVDLVLRRTRHASFDEIRSPMILTGPAGTGKTNAMLHAIQELLEHKSARILVCTPSHTAADVITQRLAKFCDSQSLFRLYSSHRPVETVPSSILRYCRQLPTTGRFCLPRHDELFKFRVIVCTCVDAHLLYRVGLTNQQLLRRRRALEEQLLSSCPSRNLQISIQGVDAIHFTHFFLDEAAQATEPESLIPLSVVVDTEPDIRKVEIALVGDPRQLSPSVYSEAAFRGLGQSWMERLLLRPVAALGGGKPHMLGPDLVQIQDWLELSFRENLSTFLTLNYRGHPSFLMMPSCLFYFDKLQSAYNAPPESAADSWTTRLRWVEGGRDPVRIESDDDMPKEVEPRKQFDWPIHFFGIVGRDKSVSIESSFSSNSWCNKEEAKEVVRIVVNLIEHKVSTAAIGVMAPFRGQVVLIRELLRKKNLGSINVGTIEDYQSVERDVIILSLTRATQAFVASDVRQRIGAFGQPKRSNVALTRAEHLFIVVSDRACATTHTACNDLFSRYDHQIINIQIGNPNVMVHDFVWKQFLLFCLRNGLFYGSLGEAKEALKWTKGQRVVRHAVDHDGKQSNDSLVVLGSLERSMRGL